MRPSFQSALRNLVGALENTGPRRGSLAACRKLSRVAADPADRRNYSAKALLKEGRTDEAEDELRQLTVLAPANAGISHEIGRLLSSRGLFSEAEALLKPGRATKTSWGNWFSRSSRSVQKRGVVASRFL